MKDLAGHPGRSPIRALRSLGAFVLFCCALVVTGLSQQSNQSAPATASPQDSATEMAVKDETSTSKVADEAKIRVNVRLVLARVVVRDGKGHAVGGLRKEDFQLFDNGKPHVISNFDVEHVTALIPEAPAPKTGDQPAVEPVEHTTAPPAFPVRYVAYLFDDLLMQFGDLAKVREAAQHRIDHLAPTDRLGIFTTSGQTVLDFTDDRAKLQDTLNKVQPRPRQGSSADDCPDISFYMADMIVNKHDQNILQTAVNDYIRCASLPQQLWGTAPAIVEGRASQVFSVAQEDSRMILRVVNDVVRRMSVLPGQRNLVLVSPGFLTPELEYEFNNLIDRAIRTQVVINSLDARGLYVVVPYGDASQQGRPDTPLPGQIIATTPRTIIDVNSATEDGEILGILADGTGGTVFRNNNDMDEGFRRVADAPEFYYVLGFTPQNLKSDGKFHTIKVSLTNRQKYDLQARRGYYAPRHDVDAAEEAKREINDEVFSSEELHELPLALHTEFFKPSDDLAKLSVLARVDVKRLHYKQSNDRNANDLTVVMAVFDQNGNFLQASQKLVEMRWKSETLQAKLASGITLKSSFDLKPGRYLVRVVARDTEQQGMAAENGAVEIP